MKIEKIIENGRETYKMVHLASELEQRKNKQNKPKEIMKQSGHQNYVMKNGFSLDHNSSHWFLMGSKIYLLSF